MDLLILAQMLMTTKSLQTPSVNSNTGVPYLHTIANFHYNSVPGVILMNEKKFKIVQNNRKCRILLLQKN